MIQVFGSAIALAGALVAVLIAVLANGLLCDENCAGRGWEISAQLWIAIAGLLATAAMSYFVTQEKLPAAKASLVAAVVAFAIWAIVLDAATHGWGHGPIPF
jgi:hypothetical protein